MKKPQDIVRDYRTKRGWSVRRMAREANIGNHRTIAQIEAGHRMRAETARKIAAVVGVPVSRFNRYTV